MMRIPSRFVLGLLALSTALVAFPIANAVVAPPRSPYLSALSDLSAAPAYAAGCQHKACFFVGGHVKCSSTADTMNCKSGPGFCESKPCPV